jgi:hypothetical protein
LYSSPAAKIYRGCARGTASGPATDALMRPLVFPPGMRQRGTGSTEIPGDAADRR